MTKRTPSRSGAKAARAASAIRARADRQGEKLTRLRADLSVLKTRLVEQSGEIEHLHAVIREMLMTIK